MAKIWTDILVPVAIVGAVAAQTLGVEISRASRLHAWFPQAVRDTVVQAEGDTLGTTDSVVFSTSDSVMRSMADSVVPVMADSTVAAKDTLWEDEDFDFFGESSQEDTMPQIFARDTMKVPDSLKVTDPFLYQWYVATRDSYTHRLVVDSLKSEGDTLIWPRIDSIYVADSIAFAKEKLEKMLAAMTKKERKRWYYENVELPVIRHRQDSILHRKDSIKRIRDSILENTPRILETSFLPDSLYYKRLVAWRHNRYNNKVETFEWDTTANYHFYDYPFMHEDVGASWLGMPGSAVQSYNYFLRNQETSTSFYAPLECWTYTPDNLAQFNTKTPYTELEYSGNLFNSSSLSADAFRVFTTQNIFPSLNIALEMKRYGGAGILKNEQSDNRTYVVAGNYLGKQYLAHAGFVVNKGTRQESGGILENTWIRDTTVDVREIDVALAAATNRFRKMSVFYDQSYRIPFEFIEQLRHRGDSTWVKPDTLNTNVTTGFIGTSSEYSTYTKKYVDNTDTGLSTFYNDVFNINPLKSTDSLRTMRLDNRIFVRLQPWHQDAVVSKLEGGVGNRLQTFYLQGANEVLYKPSNARWNSFYTYAGAEGRLSKYLEWDAMGLFNFAGEEAGDFFVKANARLNVYPFRRKPNSPVSLTARFETRLQEPDFYQQHFYSNHFRWENDFSKVSTTRIQARLDIPAWDFRVHAGYALVAGHVYYDTLGVARQQVSPVSVIAAGLSKNFVFGPVHLDNDILFQLSSNADVLPLPLLAANLRWYLQFNVVDPKVLKLQAGLNVRYSTLWYAPSYNPVAGVFTLQTQEKYGNCPVFDVFLNLQWKKACIFLKMENAGNGWPMDKHDYFTAHHYIQSARILKFGICWPFYPRLDTGKTLSERAGSGMGGGGGLGGLKGALR